MGLAVLLAIAYAMKRHSMPSIDSITDYWNRAALYRAYNKWHLILLVPAVLSLAWACSGGFGVKRCRGFPRDVIGVLPGWLFRFGFPVAFTLISGITAYFMLGATPRVLDSFNYLFQAENFARGQLYAPVPAVKECFEFPFIVMQDERWYGSVYPGFSVLLALGVGIGLPWMVNPVLGGLGLFMIYKAGRVFFHERLARCAVLLLLISPFYRMISAIHMSHASAMILALAGVMLLWKWIVSGRTAHPGIPTAAGLFLGYEYITRPQTAAIVSAPFLFYGVWRFLKGAIRIKHILLFIIPLLIFYLAMGVYNLELTGNPQHSPRYHVDPARRLGFGDDLGAPLPGGNRSGHTPGRGLSNVEVLLNLWNSDLYGWGAWGPFGFCTLLVLAAVVLPPYRIIDGVLAGGIVCNCVLYVFYFTPSPNFGPRYLAGIIPATAFLTLRGCEKLVAGTRDYFEDPSRPAFFCRLTAVFLIVISWGLFLPLHTSHYGMLPPMTPKTVVPVSVRPDSVVVIPEEFYTMNIFTWNSPDLDGIIFLRDPGEALMEKLGDAYPHRTFLYVIGLDAKSKWKLSEIQFSEDSQSARGGL
ncbi:hypothetical protein JXA40_08815 [bacterium]|nr:hypothetical protein [candidate division CSSED10-310 bacterium]